MLCINRMGAGEQTSTRILDVAEKLVQMHGFNAFSYADIASEVRVKKASLHHHFATKAKLGEDLISRYEARFLSALDEIEESPGKPMDKFSRYVDIYAGVLKRNRMCLCGILAAEYATLPEGMRKGVNRFFHSNEAWVARLLEDGRKAKGFVFDGPAIETARFVVSALEGAMMVARSQKDYTRFNNAAERLITSLRP